jgi:LmbE family N-acetylglucosaminyl deacetylase
VEDGGGGGVVALAAGAHPDDIEFMMAGTLLLLRAAGASIHMWSISDGSLGSLSADRRATAKVRLEEARASSRFAGAEFHEPVAPDMGVTCDPDTVARAAEVIRRVRPRIILAHSPADYHPDHEASSRLVVSAAFVRAVPQLEAERDIPPWDGATTIYHALPFGLLDPMRKRVRAGQYVNTGEVMPQKRRMLSMHSSQQEWLERDLGIDYLSEMERMSAEAGRASGRFEQAEGWRRRLHLGLSPEDSDPLSEVLGPLCWTDPGYEESL